MFVVLLKAILGLGGGSKRDMLDMLLDSHDGKVFDLESVVMPSDDADERNSFSSTIPEEEMWISNITWSQRKEVVPVMVSLMREMNRSSAFYEDEVIPNSTRISEEHLQGMQELAAEHGATAMRFVDVPSDAIFAGKAVPREHGIVYTVQMDKDALDTAPSFEAFVEVAKGYRQMAVIGNHVTRYLRKLGYAAYPGTALGGLSDYTRLAELAGLGAIGYHGLAITPHDGALLRINTIYTSIENLPTQTNDEQVAELAWVRDFCAMCRKCVRSCPVGAIHDSPIVLSNGSVQCIETSTCLDFFAANHGCAICADVCPFSQKGYDAIRSRFRGNPEAPKYSAATAT